MNSQMLTIVLAVLLLVLVIDLVRREKLSFKYAFGWILICVSAIGAAVFKNILFRFSYWLGFELPSNFIFFASLAGITFLSLLLTIFLCQQNHRNDKIAQKLGLLEKKLDDLQGSFKE